MFNHKLLSEHFASLSKLWLWGGVWLGATTISHMDPEGPFQDVHDLRLPTHCRFSHSLFCSRVEGLVAVRPSVAAPTQPCLPSPSTRAACWDTILTYSEWWPHTC